MAPFLKVIPQRHEMDCAVACLAMVVGGSYEQALLAFGDEMQAGATWKKVTAAAGRLGFSTRVRRKFDLETSFGILCVASPLWRVDHVVVLKEGLIVDTDSTVWDVDVYLAVNEARAVSLLTVRESE